MRLVSGTSGVAVVAVVCTLCCTGSVRGQKNGQNSGQDAGLPAESSLSLDPLIGLLGCLRDDRPGYCFQKRALGYFESWLTTSEDEDDDTFDGDNSDGAGERLPAGISPKWSKMLGEVAEKIADSYGGDDDDDDGDEPDAKNDTHLQRRSPTAVEGRGKYKKDKRVKVAMTVILLIIYFIINQLFYMFDKVARTLIFAKLLLALKIFVVVKILELKRYLWWVKEEHKEDVHSEFALHDHHYDDHHVPEYPAPDHYGPPHYHGGWGGWHSRSEDPQVQAYHAQAPAAAVPPLYPGYTPNPKVPIRRRR